jgi:hypothetical protein
MGLTPLISALESQHNRQRQEDLKSEANLGYIVKHYLKNKTPKKSLTNF